MYITICEIDDQSKFNDDTAHSKPVHWDNTEGRSGEGGGRGFGLRGHMCAMANSCQCVAKTITIL